MDKAMQALIDAPLADPLKLHLPAGKRPAPRAVRVDGDIDAFPEKLTEAEVRTRRQDAFSAKLMAVLDYYATTEIPVERIAAHTKLTVPQVINAMKQRGRVMAA